MDLNRLYFDHQLASSRAETADCDNSRETHSAEAAQLAEEIGKIQLSMGAAAAAAWTALGSAVVLRERAAAKLADATGQ